MATFDVEYAEPSDHLSDVARKMRNQHVGALFVRQREGGVAILTERDIVRAVADGSRRGVGRRLHDPRPDLGARRHADRRRGRHAAHRQHPPHRRGTGDGALGIASIKDLLAPLVEHCD